MAMMTDDARRRMELLNGIDQSNIRALDALAHASFPAAETAPTAQRGATSTGDKPSGGTTTTTWETPGGGGTTKSSSFTSTYSGGGVTEPWTGSMPTFDPFSYADAPTYGGSQYDNRRDRLLDQLEGSKFNYDPASDPVWQAYQKQYRREGQRATEDALGRAAASTGGVASSYAAQAASQAGNYYAAQLSDRLPQVYQDAYNRYLQEYERQLGLADTFNSLGQQDYNRYRDTLAQFNTDRNFAYGVYSDDYNRQMDQYGQSYKEYLDEQDRRSAERNWEYSAYLDELDRQERADQTAYNREQDALDRAEREAATQYGKEQDAMNWWWTMRQDEYNRGQNETAQQQALREYEDQQLKEQINNAYKFISTFGYVPDWAAELLGVPAGTSAAAVGLSSGGSTRTSGTGGNPSPAPEAAGPTEPETTRETKAPETVTGAKHHDGSPMTQGFSQVWKSIRNKFDAGASEEDIILAIYDALEAGRIADYEVDIILDQLGMPGGSGFGPLGVSRDGKSGAGGGTLYQMTK